MKTLRSGSSSPTIFIQSYNKMTAIMYQAQRQALEIEKYTFLFISFPQKKNVSHKWEGGEREMSKTKIYNKDPIS